MELFISDLLVVGVLVDEARLHVVIVKLEEEFLELGDVLRHRWPLSVNQFSSICGNMCGSSVG